MARRTTERGDKGVSLARFPALVLGSLLLAFGLLQLMNDNTNPTGGFTDGTVNGTNLFGFEGNGWTGLITAVAGGLLMFGAAQHLLAKTMSLLVGLALGACSVIALVDGDDVLGLAAANGWTKLGWGAAAAFLLINTLLPRKGGRTRDVAHDDAVERPVKQRRDTVKTDRVPAAPTTSDRARTGRPDDAEPVHAERTVVTERSDRVDGSVADEPLRDDRR